MATYGYYPDNMQCEKTVDNITTTHVWLGSEIALDITAPNVVSYIKGIKSSEFGWYVFNAHGDVMQLLDDDGDVVRDYQYDPFGNQLSELDEFDLNPYRYCQEYYDVESGYVYLRARYYDSSLGRFISEDPIADGYNWYIYANNNPIRFIDPSGLTAIDYLNGNKISVYRGVHEVKFEFIPTNNYHSSIIIFASHDSDFYKENKDLFVNNYSEDASYMTLGAGGFFNLKAETNRPKDVDLTTKTDMLNLSISDENVAKKLFSSHNRYMNKQKETPAKYSFFPGTFSETSRYFNSNSYVSGLLQYAKVDASRIPENSPGYEKPLPQKYFQPTLRPNHVRRFAN